MAAFRGQREGLISESFGSAAVWKPAAGSFENDGGISSADEKQDGCCAASRRAPVIRVTLPSMPENDMSNIKMEGVFFVEIDSIFCEKGSIR